MAEKSKRVTVYLEPELHKALRLKAIAFSKSVSELINEAVRVSLKNDRGDLPQSWFPQGEKPIKLHKKSH